MSQLKGTRSVSYYKYTHACACTCYSLVHQTLLHKKGERVLKLSCTRELYCVESLARETTYMHGCIVGKVLVDQQFVWSVNNTLCGKL